MTRQKFTIYLVYFIIYLFYFVIKNGDWFVKVSTNLRCHHQWFFKNYIKIIELDHFTIHYYLLYSTLNKKHSVALYMYVQLVQYIPVWRWIFHVDYLFMQTFYLFMGTINKFFFVFPVKHQQRTFLEEKDIVFLF